MRGDTGARAEAPARAARAVREPGRPNDSNQGRHHELPPQPQDQPDLPKPLAFPGGQVRERWTNYGELSGFWWDMNVEQRVAPSIDAMIHRLQPSAVINDRPVGDSVELKSLARAPRRATLLNTRRPVTWTADMAPSDHLEQAAYLRLTTLPATEPSNTVMVAKLECDGAPATSERFHSRQMAAEAGREIG